MLELIRKHQYGIMVLVAVIVIFAFAWWGDFFGRGEQVPGRGQPFISLEGRTYTRSQISKIAAGSQVAQRHFPFHMFQVERAYRRYEMPGLDYALNTLALRRHAVDFGIAVSPEEIDQRMLSIPDFQTPETRKQSFMVYGSLGLGEGDVAQIVADVITMEKLSDLVSAGLLASDTGADYDYASRYQTIFSSVARVARVKPEDVEVTEEELKEAYEAQKSGLKTERQVAIRYVFFEAPGENAAGDAGTVTIPVPELVPGSESKPDPSAPEKVDETKGEDEGDEAKVPGDKSSPEGESEDGAKGEDSGEDTGGDLGCGDESAGAVPDDSASPQVEVKPEKKNEDASGSGEDAKGEDAKGEDAKGEDAKGEDAKGEDAKGEDAKGEDAKGEDAKGEDAKGEDAKGEDAKGEDAKGEDAKGEDAKGEDAKGEEAKGEEAKGEDAKGEDPKDGGAAGESPKVTGTEGKVEVVKPKEISEEERMRLKKEFNALVDQFWGEFFEDGQFVLGVDFAAAAEDERYGLNVVETGLFSVSNPPEDIADQRDMISAAVSMSMDLPISDPVAAMGGKKGYFIFEILKVVEPREKTFEESKADLEEALRRDKSSEATLLAADEAREKVATALAAGKSFAEAASEAGLKAEEVKPFSPSDPQAEPMDLRQMLPTMMEAVPGEVSEPVDLFQGKALIYVSKRELWKRADAETLRDGVRSNTISSQGFNLLGNWFEIVRNEWNEKIL